MGKLEVSNKYIVFSVLSVLRNGIQESKYPCVTYNQNYQYLQAILLSQLLVGEAY